MNIRIFKLFKVTYVKPKFYLISLNLIQLIQECDLEIVSVPALSLNDENKHL